ncbi:MAG: PrgI family protein [Eubacteriales bacterium]
MAYVTVPKDLSAIKTKVMFNLTKRQLICFSIAAVVGGCVYYACNSLTDSSNALTFMIIAMFPFFFVGMYEKNGQPIEVIALQVYQVKYGTAKYRPYKSSNIYALLENQHDYNKEVASYVRQVQKPNPNKTATSKTTTSKTNPSKKTTSKSTTSK